MTDQHKEALVMRTITEIIGGAQGLLDIFYNLQDVFEEYLSDEYKTLFLHILRVMEEAQSSMVRSYRGTGRKPYQYQPFIRSIWAKCFFKTSTDTELIRRLKTDSNLRVLWGFKGVPGRSTFSRNLGELSAITIMKETLDKLVVNAHMGIRNIGQDINCILMSAIPDFP
jgi:transposase